MLRGTGKPYVKSLYSWSHLPPTPPYGLNWGHKIVDFVFLSYISFILYTVLRGIGKHFLKSLVQPCLPPNPHPLYGSNWRHKIADFVFLPHMCFGFLLLQL